MELGEGSILCESKKPVEGKAHDETIEVIRSSMTGGIGRARRSAADANA